MLSNQLQFNSAVDLIQVNSGFGFQGLFDVFFEFHDVIKRRATVDEQFLFVHLAITFDDDLTIRFATFQVRIPDDFILRSGGNFHSTFPFGCPPRFRSGGAGMPQASARVRIILCWMLMADPARRWASAMISPGSRRYMPRDSGGLGGGFFFGIGIYENHGNDMRK